MTELVHHRTVGLFRAGYCTLLGGVMLFDLRDTVAFYRSDVSHWYPTPFMDALDLGRPALALTVLIALLTVAAFWSAAVGFFTRLSLLAATAGYLAFHSVMLGFGWTSPVSNASSHQTNLVPFVMLAMVVTPTISRWSVDDVRRGPRPDDAVWVPAWPVRMFRFVLGAAYLGAGLSKLRVSFDWMSADNIQGHLYTTWLRGGPDLARTLSESDVLGRAMGVATILFECGFVLVATLIPIRSRLRLPLVVIGLGFHLGITIVFDIWHFLPYWGPTYLAFLTWEDLAARRGEPLDVPASSTPPTRAPRRAWATLPGVDRGAIGLVVVVMLAPAIRGAEYWPISDFGAFDAVVSVDGAQADRLVLVAADGSSRDFEPGDLGAPYGHRKDPASMRFFWFAETGSVRTPEDPEVLEAGLTTYWSRLSDELRSQYPTLELVRRQVTIEAGERLLTETPLGSVTPTG